MRLTHSIRSKNSLRELIFENKSRIGIFFGDVANGGFTDHGAIVCYLGEGLYSYTIEGHGIGSNEKSPMEIDYTVNRIFSDSQRFGGGDIVTSELNA